MGILFENSESIATGKLSWSLKLPNAELLLLLSDPDPVTVTLSVFLSGQKFSCPWHGHQKSDSILHPKATSVRRDFDSKERNGEHDHLLEAANRIA